MARIKTRISQSHKAGQDIKAVRELGKKMGLKPPLKPAERRRLIAGYRGAAILESACAAWDAYGTETGQKSFDSDGARTAIAYRAARQPLILAAHTFAQMLEDDVARVFCPYGVQALRLYKTASVLAEDPEGAPMRDAVAKMKKAMATGPRKPKTKTPPAQP